MTGESCLNCNDPDVQKYDLMLRGNSHDGVFLCDDCHEAIQREMAADS